MSERLPRPDVARFPDLARDPSWVRKLPTTALLTRIFRAAGAYPTQWHELRKFGPLDGRYDPHPEPTRPHPGIGVLYAVLAEGYGTELNDDDGVETSSGPLAAAVLEIFQEHRVIRYSAGAPTLTAFRPARPLRLLDVSDSDWLSAAGGNAALSSGDRRRAREWARAISAAYPELDGLVSASSVMPSARIVALWAPTADALPRHPELLLRLDTPELGDLLDDIADRYGYDLLA